MIDNVLYPEMNVLMLTENSIWIKKIHRRVAEKFYIGDNSDVKIYFLRFSIDNILRPPFSPHSLWK